MDFIDEYGELKDDISVSEAPYADLYELGFWKYKRARLIIIWGKNLNRNKQILMLKKLCPQLNDFSVSRIYDIVREKNEQWQFAEMGWAEAVDISRKARKMGLNIFVEEIEQKINTDI